MDRHTASVDMARLEDHAGLSVAHVLQPRMAVWGQGDHIRIHPHASELQIHMRVPRAVEAG
eukprot:scaffold17700_cov162-Cylindrotheca_fusiformis.AAC.1